MPTTLPLVGERGDVVAYTLIDPDLATEISARRWLLDGRGYAVDERGERLHRLVLGLRPGDGLHGHHLNGERLDNRRANLRALDAEEHMVAHGQRPHSTVLYRAEHPAIARGLGHWLRDRSARTGDDAVPIVAPMPSRKLPEVLTADEVAALMARPNRSAPTGLRNLAMMTLMHRCGLRVSEVCGLHLRDVEWREQRIHLRPGVAKGGHEAYVPFDDRTEERLRRWVDVRQLELRRRGISGKKELFTTLGGNPVDRRDVWEFVRRYGHRAGLERDVHPHLLRHTFATELLGEGFTIRDVQELLRHADIRTTVRYTHVSQAELGAKIRRRS